MLQILNTFFVHYYVHAVKKMISFESLKIIDFWRLLSYNLVWLLAIKYKKGCINGTDTKEDHCIFKGYFCKF